ncbi:hypothetical protein [Cupriavidus sp. AcVe19-6a]|uniref:hypothetical protein n=1 Tax=Cupriavidus sp. AcVe19-6a TaxID=2821358 RepID=UPI001AE10766|nr:hypothetical protein [Cupriavidus sp. AcVe19-6a]MBP0634893.1 hypothetical protein [Cupriavidus sp. AcVe19-6a]
MNGRAAASLIDRLFHAKPGDDLDDLVQSVSLLRLEPGDVLVVTAHGPLSQDVRDRIRDAFRGLVPGHPIAVIDSGLRLCVVREREHTASHAPPPNGSDAECIRGEG